MAPNPMNIKRPTVPDKQQSWLLFSTMLQGVVFQDAEGRIVSMNPAAELILGRSPDEFVGGSSVSEEQYTIREDGTPFPGLEHPAMVSLRTGREVADVVMGVYNHREEAYRWILVTAVPLFRPGEDRPYQVYTIFRDITERKRMEEQRAFLLKLSDALRPLRDPVEIQRTAARVLGEHLGVARVAYGEVKGEENHLAVERSYYAPGVQEIADQLRMVDFGTNPLSALRDGTTIIVEDVALTDGLSSEERGSYHRHGVASLVGVPLIKEGRFVAVLLVQHSAPKRWTALDVTLVEETADRTWSAVERARAEEALRESEAKFRDIFNSTNDAIFVADPEGSFLEVNDAACQQLGYTREEMLRLGPSRITTPEISVRVPVDISDTIGSGHKIFESAHMTKDGRRIPVELSTRTISFGGRKAILAVVRDITERKRYEEKIKRSNAELQQFAYVTSHDLQEPLRMVTNYLQLLERREGGELDETSRRYIGFAVDGAKRMKAMIDDILTYSRVESKGSFLEPVSMDAVLSIVQKDLSIAISESGASVTHGPLPTVIADKGHMILLLENLVGNAIKYRSVAAPQVNVSARKTDEEWVFSVQDNGIGIDPKYQERIFQMFQRLHTRDEYEGTGMGLAIAKRIVERYGGRIWFESRADRGSTFFFSLPVDPHR
ncbi:MAG: PAS domain S-box protein [Methanomassiliicoccus sp.]|nr:PAS domain S-box protein [Methanomassiliicoccus sp.]